MNPVVRILVSLALALPCSDRAWAQAPVDWERRVAAAKKEGPVMLYTLQSPASVDRLVSGFHKLYPEIAVQYLRASAGRMAGRLDRERAAANGEGADVWINAEPSWLKERAAEGQLLRLTGPAAAAWPAAYMSPGRDYAVGGVELQAIAYNRRLAEPPPRRFDDLLRRDFKEAIGLLEPFSATAAVWYEWLEKSRGLEFIGQLKAQKPKFYGNVGALMDALATGEIAVAALASPAQVKPLQLQGATLDYAIPEVTAGLPLFVAAIGWSRRPNAALVLADYFLTREGQTAWHGAGDSASPMQGVSGAQTLGDTAVLDAARYTRQTLQPFRERWNTLLK